MGSLRESLARRAAVTTLTKKKQPRKNPLGLEEDSDGLSIESEPSEPVKTTPWAPGQTYIRAVHQAEPAEAKRRRVDVEGPSIAVSSGEESPDTVNIPLIRFPPKPQAAASTVAEQQLQRHRLQQSQIGCGPPSHTWHRPATVAAPQNAQQYLLRSLL